MRRTHRKLSTRQSMPGATGREAWDNSLSQISGGTNSADILLWTSKFETINYYCLSHKPGSYFVMAAQERYTHTCLFIPLLLLIHVSNSNHYRFPMKRTLPEFSGLVIQTTLYPISEVRTPISSLLLHPSNPMP